MALGGFLLLLCILSCVAVCSGQGKCKALKFILGALYLVVGLGCAGAGGYYTTQVSRVAEGAADKIYDQCYNDNFALATGFWMLGANYK